jgi:hypothetical protein
VIVAVSTVKDSAVNVRRYVARNLAHGIDHLVVFTEETGAEAEAFLDQHPAVTHVPTGRGWWGEERPNDLNVRQRQAANLARVLLAPFAWAEWIVHIDGDEVALIDRDAVAALPDTVKTFKLDPLEAVARTEWPGEVTHFKRLLTGNELTLLSVLGLVETADNKAYFRGHVRGKRGVRVRTDLRIGLHTVKNGKGNFVKAPPEAGLRMLHLDAPTAEEFARKWMTLAGSGSRSVYRKSQSPVVRAVRTLASMDLPDDVRERYLRRVYELTTVEDFDTLLELGLLEEIDPDFGLHRPEAAPAADLKAFASLLAASANHSRDSLTLDHPEGGYDVLRAVLADTGVPAGPASRILGTTAAKADRRGTRRPSRLASSVLSVRHKASGSRPSLRVG